MKIAEFIHKLDDFLHDAIYPRACFICKSNGAYLCQNCLDNIEPGEAFYIPRLNRLILGGNYENPGLKKAIHFFKYRSAKEIARDLAYLLNKRLGEGIFLDSNPAQNKVLCGTILTPIPVFKNRERRRGFNQALVLSEALSFLCGAETKNLLEKIIDTVPQVETKSREERLKNVKNSFGLNKEIFFSLGDVKNLRVVIVDDVITTGSTMSEAARVLRKAGIGNIIGLALARG